ncbi:TFIIH basal transcription factor complex helicase repB subunit [Diplonema papillatum]|nr:TFIIH basal transcription factor complex helicase repB subunit [Diplonema papillatum]
MPKTVQQDADKPLWTSINRTEKDDGSVDEVVTLVVEAFHPRFKAAQDLMEMIAEPASRTQRLHIFKLTDDSLYTAVTLGRTGAEVVKEVAALSKNPPSPDVEAYILSRANKAGKVRLVLDTKRELTEGDEGKRLVGGRYAVVRTWRTKYTLTSFVEMDADVEKLVLNDPLVKTKYLLPDTIETRIIGDDQQVVKFEVSPAASLIDMKRDFKERMRLPLDSVYSFSTDYNTPDVKLRLKSTARLRPYQSLTLSKTLGNGRARSGLIVLPCGAGKTLVGVATAALLGKATIVVCLNSLTVMQWWQQFRLWTDVHHKTLSVFTAEKKEAPGDIVITTYSMLGFPDDRRAEGSPELIEALRSKEWGLMLMDEVHVAPADTFRMILNRVRAHCIIGLTATLLREDDKISNLQYLIGPKLYEANWKELCDAGYLADVKCIEVLCPVRGVFFDAYLRESLIGGGRRATDMLQIMNPTKIHVTEALIHYHRHRGDKILLFSDAIKVVDFYAKLFHIPQIVGLVGEKERYSIINHFKNDSTLYAVVLSAAAETGTDIPDANVIIQISGNFGSQRQETQRLGRILRPKHGGQGNCGWYYSLVSKDTREPGDHARRRRFLLEQGYSFKVVDADEVIGHYTAQGLPLSVSTEEEELSLLDSISTTRHTEDGGPPKKRARR